MRDKVCTAQTAGLVSAVNISNSLHFVQLSSFRFAFRIYDIDNDGYISNGELFQVNILPISNKEFCLITFIDSGVEDDGGQ